MVHKKDYPGPSRLTRLVQGVWETADLRVQVHANSLCVTVTDLARDPELALSTICPDRPKLGRSHAAVLRQLGQLGGVVR